MEYDSRLLEPHEQITMKELPPTQRGAPKVWESRLSQLINGDGKWTSYMEGRLSTLRATRSNFRSGRVSKPKGHEFECEVVTLDHQDDNMGTLFFRWVGPEKVLTEAEKEELAHQKVLARLAELESEPPPGVVDTLDTLEDLTDDPEHTPGVDDQPEYVTGDPHDDREPKPVQTNLNEVLGLEDL